MCNEKCVCFLGSNYYSNIRIYLNGPNNREILQSRLSASGHGFEPLNSRIYSSVYTVFFGTDFCIRFRTLNNDYLQ